MDYPASKTVPWQHQIDFWNLSKNEKAYYAAHDMGCGKSKAAIDYANGIDAEKILIVCPKKVISVWPNQFSIHSHLNYHILPLTKGSVKQKTVQAIKYLRRHQKIVIITNYEAFWRSPLGPTYNKKNRIVSPGTLMSYDWDLLIADEAHRIKSPGGSASWGMKRLRTTAKRVLFLSGTPMPHSPIDIYSQFRALAPKIYPPSFAQFKKRYCIMGGFEDRQVVSYINLDDLHKRFFSIAHHVTAEDTLDLPAKQTIVVTCDLDPSTLKIYRTLDKEFVAEYDAGIISADNALVKLLRLAQLAGGYLALDDDANHIIDNNKVDTVIELIKDIPMDEPVVIFCRFVNEIKRLKDMLKKIGRTPSEISGKTDELKKFQDGESDVVVTQIQAGGEGIDLTAARYCIYMSIGYSLGQLLQSRKRVWRPGQEKKVFYYYVVANLTVDKKIAYAIKKRQSVVDYVLKNLKD